MPLLIVLTLLFPGFPDYPHGITILSPFGSDKKQVLNFCAQSAEELLKFLEDLKESIAEVSEMEQIRIECEYHVFVVFFFPLITQTGSYQIQRSCLLID